MNAIYEFVGKSIRYKDIINAISDYFENNIKEKQTPFFVTQANYTEVFCEINDEIRNKPSPQNATSQKEKNQVLDTIVQESMKYCTKEDIFNMFEEIHKYTLSLRLSDALISYYALSIRLINDEKEILPHSLQITRWLTQNSNNYYVTTYTEYREQGRRAYLYSIEFDGLPFYGIEIKANALYPVLTNYQCEIVFFFSRNKIRFFYFYTNLNEIGWDVYELNKNFTWMTEEVDWLPKENSISVLNRIVSRFYDYILENVSDKYTRVEEPEVQEDAKASS